MEKFESSVPSAEQKEIAQLCEHIAARLHEAWELMRHLATKISNPRRRARIGFFSNLVEILGLSISLLPFDPDVVRFVTKWHE